MSTLAANSDAIPRRGRSSEEALALSRLEDRISPLLSVIAGMVDLTGFFTLGNIFTAHVTGNLVVVAALAVRGGPMNLAQVIAIPVFILAVAAVWMVARASGRRGCALESLTERFVVQMSQVLEHEHKYICLSNAKYRGDNGVSNASGLGLLHLRR